MTNEKSSLSTTRRRYFVCCGKFWPRHRYAVRTAEDGESALELVGEWQPDLVLTDLQMPGMNGLEFCRRLRVVSEIPIVILSVRNEEEAIVEALDAGADDYITKPFGTNELLARIRSSLRRVREKVANIIDTGEFRIDVAAHQASVQTPPSALHRRNSTYLFASLGTRKGS